jgi:hypothetical protein
VRLFRRAPWARRSPTNRWPTVDSSQIGTTEDTLETLREQSGAFNLGAVDEVNRPITCGATDEMGLCWWRTAGGGQRVARYMALSS